MTACIRYIPGPKLPMPVGHFQAVHRGPPGPVIKVTNPGGTLGLTVGLSIQSMFISQHRCVAATMSTTSSANQHACAHCPRVFTKPAHLLRHTRSHVSDRPFSCSFCHKAFTRTDTLQRHERTVHSAKRQRTEQSSASEEEPESYTETIVPDLDTMAGGWYSEPVEQAAGFDFAPSMPDPGYLPPELMPSNAAEVNNMIAEWLSQDGGLGLGLEGLFPSSFLGTEVSAELSDFTVPDNTGGRLFTPRPVRPASRRRRRTVVAVDTWESGITASAQETISRAQSPQRPLTSPEQVVGKLNVNGPHVSS